MAQRRKLPDDRWKKVRRPAQRLNTFRLFIAIFLPIGYREYFRDVLRELDKQKRNIRPVKLDQIHLTVKFIGPEVSNLSKNEFIAKLKTFEGKLPKPIIKINPIRFGFEDEKDPSHVISTIGEDQGLLDLADFLHELLKDMGLEDTIRWKVKHVDRFHITLARTRDNASKRVGREVESIIEKIKITPPEEDFIPEYIDVMESQITLNGPVYKKLARIKL